jgi:uncharacterized membrane protein YbhN (UPF0104 family)
MAKLSESLPVKDKRTWWKTVWNILRWILTPVILYLVFRKTHFSEIRTILTTIDPVWFVPAVLASYGMQILMIWRWKHLLDRNELPHSFLEVLRMHFVSLLFQSFLPTGFGGDAARMALVMRKGRGAESVNSVVLTRAAGFLVLTICVFTGSFFIDPTIGHPARFWSGLFLAGGVAGLLAVRFLLPLLKLERYREKPGLISRAVKTALNLRANLIPSTMIPLFLISLALQFASIIPVVFLFLAMRLDVGFWKIFTAIPVINLMASVVPSVNGIGPREYFTFLFFSAEFGTKEVMAVFSLGTYALILLGLIPGFFFWLFPANKRTSTRA